MTVKSNNMVEIIAQLEKELNSFSYDELTLEQAAALRQSFQRFKQDFDTYFFTPSGQINSLISNKIPHIMIQKQTKNQVAFDSKINTSNIEEAFTSNINLEELLKDCMGQIDFLEELISLNKQNIVEFIGKAKIALQTGDYETIRFASHKIKCGLKMIKANGLYTIAEQINTISRTTKDMKYLQFLYDCFVNDYPAIEKAMNEELAKYKASLKDE